MTIETIKKQLSVLGQQQAEDKKKQKDLPHNSDEARQLRGRMVKRRLEQLKPLNRIVH